MIKNYFKTAWRNIVKSRFYSIVNIIGLSTGITFTLLIAVYVWSELQVNKTINNENRIFLLQSKYKTDEGDFINAAPNLLSKTLKEQFPHLITNYYRWLWKSTVVSNGNKHFRENIQMGDTTFFSMFGFPLLYGNANTVFSKPDAVIITEEKALKIFGVKNAVGKLLTIENNEGTKHNFIVTGVLKNLPYNSVTATVAAEKKSSNSIFLPLSALKTFYGQDDAQDWENYRTSYIRLNKNVTPKDILKPIQLVLKLNTSADVQRNLQINFLSLSDYYLDAGNGTIRKMIYALSFIALLILLMAIVNFINISIGNSTSRLKEIGLRKVFGGVKKQLVFQFLTESFILVCIAVCFAFMLYQILQPVFSSLIGKGLPSLLSLPFYFIGILVLFAATIGLLAGIYPAMILSSLKITELVNGKLKSVNENIGFKKALISFQFFIAIMVFIAAIVISKQVSYVMNTDLGFNKEQILNVPLPRNWTNDGIRKMETVRNELTELPGVIQASVNYTIPDRNSSDAPMLYRQDKDSSTAVETFGIISDDKYAETFQIPLVAGKFFEGRNIQQDSSSIVINETLVKNLGWQSAGDAIGKILYRTDGNKSYTVCGVVKDFHAESKQSVIKPLAFLNIYNGKVYRFISIKIKPGTVEQTIPGIQKKWSALIPDAPFDYSFMDETLQMTYKSELQLQKASYMATTLAIIIVLLGIIGIMALSITKRTKEIGIRKVLGASVSNILALFIKDILILIAFATSVAFPVAYLIMEQWLNNYFYRIHIGVNPFIIVVVFMIIVTVLLVCIQTIKAALANPVESLRME
ncbi:MAG TPA: ABC transporter permease [Parafilimonas sp.]|nr:ABC transporter permease [Parafilimonas sp.]